jgi:hypothetical protein
VPDRINVRNEVSIVEKLMQMPSNLKNLKLSCVVDESVPDQMVFDEKRFK